MVEITEQVIMRYIASRQLDTRIVRKTLSQAHLKIKFLGAAQIFAVSPRL